jgi:hypothetical protein
VHTSDKRQEHVSRALREFRRVDAARLEPRYPHDCMTATRDPSQRYVLPNEAPYLKNLAALWAIEPALAAAIEATDATPSYPAEPSKSGPPTVSAPSADGRVVQLHSRYKPLEEAKQLVDSLSFDDGAAYFVHGFALGYHVEQLFDRAGREAILCIVEPDLAMLRTAFELRDFSDLIRSGRAVWLWREDKADVFNKLNPHQPLVSLGFQRLPHPPSVQRHPEFHAQVQGWVTEFEAYAKTTVNTLVINSRRTAENVAANLPWYVATPSLARLQGAYQKQPAIIVSAGPSLRKNKHLLKDAQEKAVLIAVQTTLQPLLEMDVEPHFVTSLDYHDICMRFFEKLPPTLKTELVAEPKATPAIFDMNPGPLSLLGNETAELLLAEMELKKARLQSGATVAHLAYYLAEHLGCEPIIFIGQDLGFSDGLCYAPGTSYDDVWRPEFSRFCTVEMKQWEQIVRERPILRKVPDQQGRPMYTEERLFTYLQHFERDFAQTKTQIIDATEGGALKRGTTVMPLAEALSRFCARPLGAKHPKHPGLRWDRLDECIASLEKRRDEAKQIQQISRDTLPLLEEVRDHIANQARVNRAIAKIDALRTRINALGACYSLVMQLTQKTELERFKSDRKIAAAKVDGVELQRRQADRDIANVRAVLEAGREFENLVENAIENVKRFKQQRARGGAHREAA